MRGIQQAELASLEDGLCAAGHLQLGEGLLVVPFHCAQREIEMIGDGLV